MASPQWSVIIDCHSLSASQIGECDHASQMFLRGAVASRTHYVLDPAHIPGRVVSCPSPCLVLCSGDSRVLHECHAWLKTATTKDRLRVVVLLPDALVHAHKPLLQSPLWTGVHWTTQFPRHEESKSVLPLTSPPPPPVSPAVSVSPASSCPVSIVDLLVALESLTSPSRGLLKTAS